MEILSTLLLVLAAGAVLNLRHREGGAAGSPPAGATVIRAPSLGVLDLQGEAARAVVDEDREALGSLFSSAGESDGEVPRCDVLLVYCAIGGDGRIAGSQRGLRERSATPARRWSSWALPTSPKRTSPPRIRRATATRTSS